MKSHSQSVPADPARAGRAIGAMFFSVFGGLWLGLWANDQYPGFVALQLVVASVTAALLAASYRVYKANSLALKANAETPESRRKSRRFRLINATQWSVIFLVAFILSATGNARWNLPAIILIVGLHFLPLASLFEYRPHYFTGAALILLACVYPLVARGGPENAIGALGAGLILWASALWALVNVTRAMN
jgi:cytochrome bd-type quinol oxidase subunit 2